MENNAPTSYSLGRVLFVRGTGLIFLIAFLSWWSQAIALTGEDGLLPVGTFLERVREASLGWWEIPSLFWMDDGDAAIHTVCAVGALAALAAVLGFTTGPALVISWVCYLSLVTTGGVFMSFQWDILLLETGVLAAIAGQWRGWHLGVRQPPPLTFATRLTLWLAWLVVAKLMFLSGWVKLAWATEQQPEWWPEHTAMTFHYFTQPLPTWTAWWAHQLPEWFQKTSIWPMYFVELVLPFAVFCGRRRRLIAALGFATLMGLIAATGNYTYFNFLTIVLCLPLVADRHWRRLFRRESPESETGGGDRHSRLSPRAPVFWLRAPAVALLLVLNFQVLYLDLSRSRERPWLGNLRLTSGYGLFRTMTITRPEIVIEGSLDGRTWREYELPWKPGELDRRPRFVAPHQPRLDWQFWFFALGQRYDSRNSNAAWFSALIEKVLRGDENLDAYFSDNPFPEIPPKLVRAKLYEYEFTTIEQRRETGNWWKRREVDQFLPMVSLQNF